MANTYKEEIVDAVASWASREIESGVKSLCLSKVDKIIDSVDGIDTVHNAKKYLNHAIGYKLKYTKPDNVVKVEYDDVMIDEDGQAVPIRVVRVAGRNRIWEMS